MSGREAIGQHRRTGKPQRPDAGDARRGHIILVEFAKRGSAHQAHVARQIDDRHRDDGVGEARPQHRDDENGEHQARHRHDQVHQPRDGDIDDRAGHRGGEAERDADDERHAHHREADEQRHARAVDEAREHVVAVAVGARARSARSRPPPRPAAPARRRGTARSANRARRRSPPRRRRTTRPKTASPNTAPLFSRNAAQNAAQRRGLGEDGRRILADRRCSAAASAAMADPRIDDAVDEVDDQIDADRRPPRSA